jgi:acyl carrier protein
VQPWSDAVTQDTLEEELKVKLVETLGLGTPAEEIQNDAPLLGAGLGIDSIDTLELVVMVEKDYGVKIDNRAAGVQAFSSISALADYIRQHRPASS